MSEKWTELPVVVEGRWALAQALRQWKSYADDISACDHKHYLGDGNELEDKFYSRAKAALEGLEAAADESAKASLAPKTAFAPAHGWPSLRWTAEKPAAAGWWWLRDGHDGHLIEPVLVEEKNGRLGVHDTWGGWELLTSDYWQGAWWAGPLHAPVGTPDEESTANDGTELLARRDKPSTGEARERRAS